MTTATQAPQLLSVDDLAHYLRVPKTTLYIWRTRKLGPPGIKVGRHVRYRQEDVAEWLEEHKAVSHSEEPDGVMPVGTIVCEGGVAPAVGAAPSPTAVLSSAHTSTRESNRHGSPAP